MLELGRVLIDAGATTAAFQATKIRPQIATAHPPGWWKRRLLRRKSAAAVHRQSAGPVAVCAAVRAVIDPDVRALATRMEGSDPDAADRLRKTARQIPRDLVRERFAERADLIIQYRGIKPRDIADRMGLDSEHGHKTISRYRHADNTSGRMPPYAELLALAQVLDVSVGFFLDDDPPELEELRRGTL
jgi:hypothetical protein